MKLVSPPQPPGDPLVARLSNVFRVLSKPEHALRGDAVRLRQEISSSWSRKADHGDWFAWPKTIALPGTVRLTSVDWRPYGMLSYLGYHVGETRPTAPGIRQCILEYVFECHLPPLDGPSYYSEWGRPLTAHRLKKLANTLAALTRNTKRKNSMSYAKAIDDWEGDLEFLHDKYYRAFFHFGWPVTTSLH
jgi:hypothetical protein